MVSAVGAKLRVSDEDFLVASLIERCPKSMMSRELVKNALEAASRSQGERVVEISGVKVNGVPKLCIWNTGEGLSASDLFEICDIASSIRKEKGLRHNFGMGAKVASLPSNQLGMRYRSCRRGKVHEVVIGKRDGVYGRLAVATPGSGIFAVVADVTSAASQERRLSQDWTEVVLLGNSPEQNTVADPYGGDPEVEADWIAAELYARFFRVRGDVELRILDGGPKRGAVERFATLEERGPQDFAGYECVIDPDGFRLHYFYDVVSSTNAWVNESGYGAMQEAKSMAGLVYADEIYSLAYSWDWTRQAPDFGIPFGARQISVFVELPDSYPLIIDGYRQFLRHRHGAQEQVGLREFIDRVRDHRPQWLIDLMREMAPDSNIAGDVRQELQKALRTMGVRRPGMDPEALPPASDGEAAPPQQAEPGPETPVQHEAAPAAQPPAQAEAPPRTELSEDEVMLAPDIFFLRDDTEVGERNFIGRAARYYEETNAIFINLMYPAVKDIQVALSGALNHPTDPEAGEVIRVHVQRVLALRIGMAVVYALAKRGEPHAWPDWAVTGAITPEALTIAADDFHRLIPAMAEAVSQELAGRAGSAPP